MSKETKKYKQTCYLIYGMHRSGTSAFAGLLNQLDIPMGANLLAAGYDNPKGFYENEELVRLNEEVLSILGQSWDTMDALPIDWLKNPQLITCKSEITNFLKTTFENQPVFALKDPRFSLTFPLWETIFQSLNIQLRQFILIRHPYEVAASLMKRNQFSRAKGTTLWIKYNAQAELVSRKYRRYFISYEQLLTEPKTIFPLLDLKEKYTLSAYEKIASDFLTNGLRHHRANQIIEAPLLAKLYAALVCLTKDRAEEDFTIFDKVRNSELFKNSIKPINVGTSLAIDLGTGFNQLQPITQTAKLDTKELEFELALKETDQPFKLRFYPTNKLASVLLTKFDLFDLDREIIPIQQTAVNALLVHQDWYIVNETSFIEFQLPISATSPKFFKVKLIYKKIGKSAETDIKAIGTQIRADYENQKESYSHSPNLTNNSTKITQNKPAEFWLPFVKTIFKYPSGFLKNINFDNLRILQKALTNEPPALILRNLRNKLMGRVAHPTFEFSNAENDKSIIASLPQKIPKRNGNILYITTHLPDYDKSSGGKRATRLLTLLGENFDLYVLSLGERPIKYVKELAKNGITVLETDSIDAVKKELPTLKIIICAVFGTFPEGRQLKTYYPTAKLIIDTVDVHWVREERSLGIIEGMTVQQVQQNKQRELSAYQGADEIWAVTEADKQAILSALPAATVNIVSNIHEPITKTYKDRGNNNLLFIGSYKHEPNISAVKKLAIEILPLVRREIRDAQLIIAGSNASAEIIALGKREGILFKGFVEEADLADLYQATFLSVSPLLAGAGIKGKICEAIAYHTPVLTNAIGNEGIGLIHEKEGLITTLEMMPEVLIKALKRGYDFEQMTINAQQKLFELVSPKVVKRRMLQSIYPTVSICIVTWNKLALLKKCIDAILQHTNYPNYKILVHSNGCTDGTQAYLGQLAKESPIVSPILSSKNEVFVLPNNKMMQLFPAHDVVLVNNDVIVTKNWLLELHKAAYLSKDIGIAGGKILYPDGRLQEFGAELYADGRGNNIGKFDNPNQPKYNQLKEAGYVSGCLMYIKRKTIATIGVFDEQFHPCYCEDSDYCYSAKEQGIKTIVTPNSVVYHDEGATSGKDTANGFKKYQTINMQKFLTKHQGKKNGIFWDGLEINNSRNEQIYESFIFTHIPKCGGTSFRHYINQAALAKKMNPQLLYIPGCNDLPNDKNLSQLTEKESKQLKHQPFKILASHTKFEAHLEVGLNLTKPFYYTILRDPVARFISHYNFFYYKQGIDDCKNVPLEALAGKKLEQLIYKLANLQVAYLSNTSANKDEKQMMENLALAKHNLKHKYAAFGFLEDMPTTIATLKKKIPDWLALNESFPTLNQYKVQQTIPESILEKIKLANKWDIALYKYAKQLIDN